MEFEIIKTPAGAGASKILAEAVKLVDATEFETIKNPAGNGKYLAMPVVVVGFIKGEGDGSLQKTTEILKIYGTDNAGAQKLYDVVNTIVQSANAIPTAQAIVDYVQASAGGSALNTFVREFATITAKGVSIEPTPSAAGAATGDIWFTLNNGGGEWQIKPFAWDGVAWQPTLSPIVAVDLHWVAVQQGEDIAGYYVIISGGTARWELLGAQSINPDNITVELKNGLLSLKDNSVTDEKIGEREITFVDAEETESDAIVTQGKLTTLLKGLIKNVKKLFSSKFDKIVQNEQYTFEDSVYEYQNALYSKRTIQNRTGTHTYKSEIGSSPWESYLRVYRNDDYQENDMMLRVEGSHIYLYVYKLKKETNEYGGNSWYLDDVLERLTPLIYGKTTTGWFASPAYGSSKTLYNEAFSGDDYYSENLQFNLIFSGTSGLADKRPLYVRLENSGNSWAAGLVEKILPDGTRTMSRYDLEGYYDDPDFYQDPSSRRFAIHQEDFTGFYSTNVYSHFWNAKFNIYSITTGKKISFDVSVALQREMQTEWQINISCNKNTFKE
jgi:hypothetical protein